jgi:hypothetical protein
MSSNSFASIFALLPVIEPTEVHSKRKGCRAWFIGA